MIGWIEAVVLGLMQGLTEFLPISSSAHIRVVSAFLGWKDPGAAFTAVIQLGTETAVLIYFRQEIWEIVSTWTRSLYTPALRSLHAARMGWYVIVGSIPIGVLGLLLQGPDRDRLPRPAPGRHHADRLRAHPLVRRPHRPQQAHAGQAPEPAARPGVRLRPVTRPDPGRLPLGRHHHRRPAAGLPARGRRPNTPSCWPSRPCWPRGSWSSPRSARARRPPGDRRSSPR